MSYSITQKISGASVATGAISVPISSMSYHSEYNGDKIQQLYFALPNINTTSCYWVRLTMPQNQSYDLNYGIRLIKSLPSDTTALKDITDYQFVKYISIPKNNNDDIGTSVVWLYKEKEKTNINAAVAISDNNEHPGGSVTEALRANKFYYNDNNKFYYYDNSGNLVTWTKINEGIQESSTNCYDYIDYYSTILPHYFDEGNSRLAVNEFLIIPSSNDYKYVYLYLKPIDDDRNIIWRDGSTTMMGRHIENPSDNIKITCKSLGNSDNIVANLGKVTNIGVWGRPQQMMAINGQELKIGPSGYYELKDYIINSLYVINSASTDKYTVDIQYETQGVLNG